MEQCIVSVIVAIYNVGKYLEQCIQSIMDQTYKNLEIILIDDGSPDNSPQICDDFSRKDKRIRVIHKSNEGSVYARRDGLLSATGKYVLLVDGDDFADFEYINNLVFAAENENADVVIDSFLMSYPDREYVERIYFLPGMYSNERLKKLKERLIYSGEYFQFGVNPALWNKLFRRDKLLEFYKNVPRGLTLGEDFAVSMPYMASTDRIVILDSGAYYHYRQRTDSMVKAYNAKLTGNINLLMRYLDDGVLGKSMDGQLLYYYSWLLLCDLKNALNNSSHLSEQMRMLKGVYNDFNRKDIVGGLKKIPTKYRLAFSLLKHNQFCLLAIVFRFAKK